MKKHITVIHAHTSNRGDESAVKAMVAELNKLIPELIITISLAGPDAYPNMPNNVEQIERFPKNKSIISKIDFILAILSSGKLCFTREGRNLVDSFKKSDLILHAPGGPSIGALYRESELRYLLSFKLAKKMKKKYMFYSPSMGPFIDKDTKRNSLRKSVLLNASAITIRDEISLKYIEDFVPEVQATLTFDSALQNRINVATQEEKYDDYIELRKFISNHKLCIGITITDLMWHPRHASESLKQRIESSFKYLIDKLVDEGIGVVFIPQLYGAGNDTILMEKYMHPQHTFMIEANDSRYDAEFQQHVISKLNAVIGMRYHSNIFSAKMNTPFLSISYEQKMSGFMKMIGLEKNCLDVHDLTPQLLYAKYVSLINNLEDTQKYLEDINESIREKSRLASIIVHDLVLGEQQ